MKFRYIDTPRLIFQLLRSNYAVRTDTKAPEQPRYLTYLYRLCLALVWPLDAILKNYYKVRSKWYMLTACYPSYGQAMRVIDYWYPDWAGQITIEPSQATITNSYWYAEPTPPVYLYAEATPPVYLGRGVNYSEAPIVNIPQALVNDTETYNQLIRDLDILFPFYVPYAINITQ